MSAARYCFPRGVWLQRYSIFGDLHFSPSQRFFGQLTSALETGRAGGPGPRMKASWNGRTPLSTWVPAPGGTSATPCAWALSLTSECTIRRGLVFTAIYTFLKPGSFIRDTGSSEDIDFTELTLQYRF